MRSPVRVKCFRNPYMAGIEDAINTWLDSLMAQQATIFEVLSMQTFVEPGVGSHGIGSYVTTILYQEEEVPIEIT